MIRLHLLLLLFPTLLLSGVGPSPAKLTVVGEWQVRVLIPADPGGPGVALEVVVSVPKPEALEVQAEAHASLPRFNPRTAGWVKGRPLNALRAQETTTPYLLDRESLVVRTAAGNAGEVLQLGQDYEADLDWGTVGRSEGSRIGTNQPVYASYRYYPLRLHALILTRDQKVELRLGEPKAAAPKAKSAQPGERALANIWLPGRVERLEPKHLLPVLEADYPEAPKPVPSIAEQLLPNTMGKIRTGKLVRILAWGDSVTDGGYLPDPARERWQNQFLARLRQRFPDAKFELSSEAWGGRNTASYLAEPPGSPHNYREKVLGAKPDLIVSEFVNDAGLNPQQVEERYSKLLADFRGIQAEWIILTPHYVRPDWMGLTRETDIDSDPRPYVAGVRQFGATHGVAIAEGSKRYGRLWRQGIPYTTLMLNSINHPDAQGMRLFADALMELFP